LISSHIRHIIKSLTWRITATLDTFILSYLISNSISLSFKISSIEIFTKILLYYIHERFWFKSKVKNHNIRHLIKPFTWRFVGTLDTLIISSLIFDNFAMGFQLASIETITKIVLYYIHDKIWYKFDIGIKKRNEF